MRARAARASNATIMLPPAGCWHTQMQLDFGDVLRQLPERQRILTFGLAAGGAPMGSLDEGLRLMLRPLLQQSGVMQQSGSALYQLASPYHCRLIKMGAPRIGICTMCGASRDCPAVPVAGADVRR